MRTYLPVIFATVAIAAAAVEASPSTPTELLGFVPGDARVVIGVDVAALRNHPAVQDWLFEHQSTWSGVDDDGAAFLRDAGIDPTRDVDAMLFAASSPENDGHFIAFFAGRYDPTSLGAALVAHGATSVSIGEHHVYRIENDHHGGVHPPVFLHVSPDLLTFGPELQIQDALHGPGPGSTLVGEEIAAGRLDPRASFWMVTRIPESVHEADIRVEGEMAGIVNATKTLQRVTMQATLGAELRLQASARTDSAENAELLRDAVKGALAAARLAAQEKHPDLVDVLREVDVETARTEVEVEAELPIDLIQRLFADSQPEGVTVAH